MAYNQFLKWKNGKNQKSVLWCCRKRRTRENSTLEIDSLIQKENLYPIEVKAEENLKSKSLCTVYERDDSLKPCRFSMSGYREQNWMKNIPLYLVSEWISLAE